MHRSGPAWAWVAVLAAASWVAAAADPPSHVLVGELVRVSLPRSSVGVKLAGPPAREVEVRVGPGTSMSSRGRPLQLADLRTGERIMVACTDDAGGVHRAQRIKLGGAKPR
jgi:hypothetical protein